MGRQSKATLAQLNNLIKPANPQNPTVEEVFDKEDADFEDEDFLEQGFFFLDEEHPPEDESDGSDRGHICDYYPKYHCELNFIKQYWGAAKLIYRTSPKMTDMKEMEENVKNSLDNVPLVQIQR